MSERKIIQITSAVYPDSSETGPAASVIYALCNDASLWEWHSVSNGWSRIPAIPQDETP